MSSTLYLECLSGISGDMTVAALLDLGADQKVMENALKSLSLTGFETKVSRVKKSALDVCDFQVILDEAHENHDHDMEYLHGNEAESHHHSPHAGHAHEHHTHEHYTHGHHTHEHHIHEQHVHVHRGLADILAIIEKADMTDRAKKTAADIFTILGRAEAKAHGVELQDVHFHEVGAVDSIVDIVAAAVCLDNLDVTEVIVPKLCEGQGTVRCQHGIIPVPVPAVLHISQSHDLTLQITDTQGELVTPTGAAIVAAVSTARKLPEQFTIKKCGMGAGKRNYERPSILRAMLIEANKEETDIIYKLESNIDDCTGEALGYAMERLLREGAKDVHYTPVYMKKNRPAYELSVICKKEDVEKLEQIIFSETTTIGIRRMRMERSVLKREIKTIHTALGDADIKVCQLGGAKKLYPEYDSVADLCRRHQLSFQKVWEAVKEAAQKESL